MAIIGIDLDDVLADFITEFVRLANKRFGRPPIGTAPVDWEWSNMLPDPAEQALVWQDTDEVVNFWEHIGVEEGASARMLFRLDMKHELYFPTARRAAGPGSLSTYKQSSYWLQRHFGLEFPRVIVSYEKGPLAPALKYDYFIDDRPKNCQDIKKALPNCKVYLKDSSHNQAFDAEANGFTRVKDFDTFAKIVLEETK